MKEIRPGVHHWTVMHPVIRHEVSSYYLSDEKILIDPLSPPEGAGAFRGGVDHILLTNRHHYRDSGKIAKALGCTVWCVESGLHEFTHGEEVKPFRFGDTLPGGIEAIEVGAICPDETALLVPRGQGLLAVADGVVRDKDGPLGFVPDEYIGEDAEAVKKDLLRAYRSLLDRRFDTLLLAHGWPVVGSGKEALQGFAQA